MKGGRNIRNATTTIKLSCRRRCLWCLLYPKRSCLFAPHRRCRRPRRWDERGCQFVSPPPPALQLLFLTNTHTPRSCGCCPTSKQHASSYNTVRHGGNRVCSMSLSEATSAHGLLDFVTLEWSDYLPEDNNPNYSPYPVHSTATVTCLLSLQSFQMYRLRSLLSPLNEWVGQRASRDPLVIASVGMKRN